jgi:hypothetical protein
MGGQGDEYRFYIAFERSCPLGRKMPGPNQDRCQERGRRVIQRPAGTPSPAAGCGMVDALLWEANTEVPRRSAELRNSNAGGLRKPCGNTYASALLDPHKMLLEVLQERAKTCHT